MPLAQSRARRVVLLAAIAAALAAPLAQVRAEILEDLVTTLKDKGVLSEEEYEKINAAIAEERLNKRAERRKARQREAEEAARREITSSGKFRDGFSWESADGSASFSVNGRAQLDYRGFGGQDDTGTETFDLRRAYLGARGRFLDDYTYEVTADFVQTTTAAGTSAGSTVTVGSPQLDVAWLNVAWWPQAQLRFGQFKMPMTIEELTSSRFIDFQERSLVNALAPAKERGAMLHGTPIDGVFYGIALATGQGKNNNESNATTDENDLIARLGVNIAELSGNKLNVYHLAASHSSGDIPPVAPPAGRTEARGISFFSAAAFTGGAVERTRSALEAAVAIGSVKLQAEYLNASFAGSSSAGVSFDRDISAYYLSMVWLITGERYADSYKSGAFGWISPRKNFKPGEAGANGAWEIGLRYSNWDASDFRTSNPAGTGVLAATTTNETEAWTLGLKFVPMPNVRFLVNYVTTDFNTPVKSGDTSVRDETALMFRAQIDF